MYLSQEVVRFTLPDLIFFNKNIFDLNNGTWIYYNQLKLDFRF